MIEPLIDVQSPSTIKGLSRPTNNLQEDPNDLSKQIETLFLTELLKNLFAGTEFGKNKVVGSYMPFFTAELANSFAERGIGVGDFLTASERLKKGDNLRGANHNKQTLHNTYTLSGFPRLALSTGLSLSLIHI